MKYWYSSVGARVWCDDCEWNSESYKNAQAIAKKHAKKYGHRVNGELEIVFGYDAREEIVKE